MKAIVRLAGCVILLVSLATLVPGCTGGGNTVTGKIVKNGSPLQLSDKAVVHMSFAREEDKEGTAPYPVSVNLKDGTFVVNARGDGTTPTNGKYRVDLAIIDPYPNGKDILGGKFSGKNAHLVKEVSGATNLTIDVGKEGG